MPPDPTEAALRQQAITQNRTVFGPMDRGIGLYFLPSGEQRYRVVYRVGRKQRSKGGFTKVGAAEKWKARNTVAIEDGGWIDSKNRRMTFGPFAAQWLKNYRLGVGRKRPRPTTVYRVEGLLRTHILPFFQDTQFREFDLDPSLIEEWLGEMATKPARSTTGSLSQSTIIKTYRLLAMILKSAVQHHHLRGNPCTVTFQKVKPDTSKYADIADPDLVRRIADHMRDEVWRDDKGARHHRRHAKYRTLILLAGFGGPRWGEAIALRRRDVDLTRGTVRIRRQVIQLPGKPPHAVNYTKTDAGLRTVRLMGEIVEALRHHLEHYAEPGPDGLLWTARQRSGRTGHLRASNWRRDVWLPAKRALGLTDGLEDLVFHDLRHAAGTLAAQAGGSTKDIQQRLGHASEAAALRYQHSTEATQQALADRLDALLRLTSPAGTGTEGLADVVPIRPPD